MIPIKIVLFSDYNPFARSLISRLEKEGHKVFVVTGSPTEKRRKPKEVFQEYRFTFTSESLPAILKNINPDIAIFDGELANLSDYSAGITNIMLALKESNIQKMLYVSSLSIFSGNDEEVIDETTEALPLSDQEKTILMGEKVSREYSRTKDYQVAIVRFGEVYGAYKKDYLEQNICTELCKNMIENETIELNANKKHPLIYMDDAVDALYKVMTAEGDRHEIYHVASTAKNIYSETEIMGHLQATISYETEVKVLEQDQVAKNPCYRIDKLEKLGFNEKYTLEDKIEELYYAIRKSDKRAIRFENEKESILGKIFEMNDRVKDKLLPYLENIIFFIFLNIFIYLTQSMSFHEVVDVYLLYIVVISLIYGFEQSIFTIILSVLAKIYLTVYTNVKALSLVNEDMYMWILFVFTIGTLVGYLKEQYKIKYSDMMEENHYLEKQLQDVKKINAINVEVKELYESRLLNYDNSFGRIHEITSKLDLAEPQAIIFKAIRVIQNIMNTEDVSIYISSGSDEFFRLIASAAKQTTNLGASLRTADYGNIFEKMKRKEIFVNTDLNPDYPMMAGGIYKNGHLQSIIMVWSLPFASKNLYQMNVFDIACRLIESRLNVAYEYMSNISTSYQFKYDNMLDEHSFEKTLELYQLGHAEEIVNYSLLTVQKEASLQQEALIDTIKKNVRETDYIHVDEQATYILLANTDPKGAQFVMNRLRNDGLLVKEGGFRD